MAKNFFDELRHLFGEGEELLLSIFYNGFYHVLVYNKNYNVIFYFKAIKFSSNEKYLRSLEEIVTPVSLKEKLSHILSPDAIEFLEKILFDNRQYAT